MAKALISDISRVLLFPKDKEYQGSLNALHKEMLSKPEYKFFDYFEVNEELINFYKTLKDKLDLYIFTSETIQDAPELQPYWEGMFTKIYSASKMGISKNETPAYDVLVKDIGLEPEELIYIDDSNENISAASQAGLHVIQYTSNEKLFMDLNSESKGGVTTK